ncbi:translation initiation factor IF-2-like, partial [Homarus americanus]|uniref:translation initiation factor IF-2-like n=1 Tax=Homarus americanus TaxID=6706 RepID=UPI001C439B6A
GGSAPRGPSRSGGAHRGLPKGSGAPRGPPKGGGTPRGPPKGGGTPRALPGALPGAVAPSEALSRAAAPSGTLEGVAAPPRAAGAFPGVSSVVEATPGAAAPPKALPEMAALSRGLQGASVLLGALPVAWRWRPRDPPKGSSAARGSLRGVDAPSCIPRAVGSPRGPPRGDGDPRSPPKDGSAPRSPHRYWKRPQGTSQGQPHPRRSPWSGGALRGPAKGCGALGALPVAVATPWALPKAAALPGVLPGALVLLGAFPVALPRAVMSPGPSQMLRLPQGTSQGGAALRGLIAVSYILNTSINPLLNCDWWALPKEVAHPGTLVWGNGGPRDPASGGGALRGICDPWGPSQGWWHSQVQQRTQETFQGQDLPKAVVHPGALLWGNLQNGSLPVTVAPPRASVTPGAFPGAVPSLGAVAHPEDLPRAPAPTGATEASHEAYLAVAATPGSLQRGGGTPRGHSRCGAAPKGPPRGGGIQKGRSRVGVAHKGPSKGGGAPRVPP